MTSPDNPFEHVGLVIKPDVTPGLVETLGELAEYLDRRGIRVHGDAQAGRLLNTECNELRSLADKCDLVIVVGGDGTLLSAARSLADRGIPLLGINMGRLGFLVDISPRDMIETVEAVLAGKFEEDRRLLLSASVNGGTAALALNDVVLHKWNVARMIEFETWVDDRFVSRQRSDGMIISTPTGSTAYALSGGGPLMAPGLDAISLVPICPHTLSNRPIVIRGDSTIDIVISRQTDVDAVRLTCDGQESCGLGADATVTIRRHPLPVRLLHPSGHDHFSVLRAKLGWGELPRN